MGLVLFQRFGDELGDGGVIRVHSWLHHYLDALAAKVCELRARLQAVSASVDNEMVLARAKGRTPAKPWPTEQMSARAYAAIHRAVTGPECHAQMLLNALEDLRAHSAPEHMPDCMEIPKEACAQLRVV